MDLQELDRSVEFFFRNGLANSTQRTYNSAKKRYIMFCSSVNLPPLPVTEQLLCRFVSYLANQSLTHSTIKGYLAGVRHLHIAEGLGDPRISAMAQLEQVLRGVKLTQARGRGTKGQSRSRLPITVDLLCKLKKVWSDTASGTMLWAAASTCFFGFLRSGEVTIPSDHGYDEGAHLSFADVAVDCLQDPKIVKIKIKASKTDPFRLGVDIFIGRTNDSICPVVALMSYMAKRGNGPGPLFKFEDGKPLTRARFVAKVKEALTSAGVDSSHYSGHSFRSGAATTASKQWINDATIKMLGRWKSNAYLLYIKTPREQLAAISRLLTHPLK